MLLHVEVKDAPIRLDTTLLRPNASAAQDDYGIRFELRRVPGNPTRPVALDIKPIYPKCSEVEPQNLGDPDLPNIIVTQGADEDERALN